MNLKKQITSLNNIRGAMIFEFFSPGIPIILKNAGCQFIIFDMEHGGLSLEQFKTLGIISNANNISPLIRIPEVNYNYVARALDLGAAGIMAPMVNTCEEALKIVQSSKYPPKGVRGAGFGFAHEYDVERKFRETRLYQVAPISTNLILSYIAEHVLDMPRSF